MMPGMSDEEMRGTISTRQAEYLTLLLLYLTKHPLQCSATLNFNPHQEVIISFCCIIKLNLLSCENAFLFLFALYFYLKIVLF
jgi:hypothetical protein